MNRRHFLLGATALASTVSLPAMALVGDGSLRVAIGGTSATPAVAEFTVTSSTLTVKEIDREITAMLVKKIHEAEARWWAENTPEYVPPMRGGLQELLEP